jgi:hypothetical protein
MLLALINLATIPPVTASLLMSLTASALTAAVLLAWARKLELGPLAFLPALIYSLFPRSVTSEISGMETAVFTLLIVLALYLLHAGKDRFATCSAVLAALTRPEGLMLLAFVLTVALIRNRVKAHPAILAPLLLLVAWLALPHPHFGTIVPNSVVAKQVLYQDYCTQRPVESLSYMLGLGSPPGWFLVAGVICGAFFSLGRHPIVALSALFGLSYIVALAVGSGHIFPWYPVPVYPLLFLVAVYAFHQVIVRVSRRSKELPALAAGLLALFITAAAVVGLQRKLDYLQVEMGCYESVHRTAGDYLRRHAQAGDVVLAEDIGQLAYISGLPLVDLDGLVSPEVIPYMRADSYNRLADSLAAEWVFIARESRAAKSILAANLLIENYRIVRTLTCFGGNTYFLFRRETH